MKLPVRYSSLSSKQKQLVRAEYAKLQNNLCYYCKRPLAGSPPEHILAKKINRNLFPVGFFNYPVHLQHCHKTDMTEGAVHNYCNAVMWQYEGR